MPNAKNLSQTAIAVKLYLQPAPPLRPAKKEAKLCLEALYATTRLLVKQHYLATEGWDPRRVQSYEAARYYDLTRHHNRQYYLPDCPGQVARVLAISNLDAYRNSLDKIIERRHELRTWLGELLPAKHQTAIKAVTAGYRLEPIADEHLYSNYAEDLRYACLERAYRQAQRQKAKRI